MIFFFPVLSWIPASDAEDSPSRLCGGPYRADQVIDAHGGSVAPAMAARQVATFDKMTPGQHVIAHPSTHQRPGPGERRRLPPKNDRYVVAGEIWTCAEYGTAIARSITRRIIVRGGYSDNQALSEAMPGAVFGGSWKRAGKGARQLRTCSFSPSDLGEPLKETRMGPISAARLSLGTPRRSTCRCGRSCGARGAAWDKALRCGRDVERKTGAAAGTRPTSPNASRLCRRGADVHDERLWME